MALADSGGNMYILTIPDTPSMTHSGWNEFPGGISVKAGTSSFTADKLIITVSSDNEWQLVRSPDKSVSVGYTMASQDNGTQNLTWEFASSEVTAEGTAKTIGVIVEDYSSKPMGTYNDTITFTVNVEQNTVAVTGVSITNAPTEALFVNSTGTLTASVSPDNATDKTVTWSSSDPDYVSVDVTTGKYEVRGVKGYGSAIITATAGDKTDTCTITGKVTYTSLKAGDVIRVGDTFYAGRVYFNTTPSVSFQASNGVITLVEDSGCYKFRRGSNGTMPNVTAYKVTDNTDGIYIVSGSGTSTSDRFTIAVHTK